MQKVNKAATTTTIIASPNPSVFGQVVTFTATVSAATPGAGIPTGIVIFKDGDIRLGTATLDGTGHATLKRAVPGSVGSHTITATYRPGSHFTASQGSLAQTVGQATTTTTIIASTLSAPIGKSVSFTATVNPVTPGAGKRTGTVTFYDNGIALGPAVTLNSSGQAALKTSALPLGSDTITATYSGDTNFTGSTGSLGVQINASMAIASLAVQHASVGLPASGINDAAIASLLAEWSQDSLEVSDSLSSALSA